MRIFLTGATGFIGAALIPELLQACHQVLGLTRSESGAAALRAAGAEPHHGDLEDLETLRTGAADSDGVIHLAFNHDFSKYMQNCENDRLAIEAIGSVLTGSTRPFVITSGTAMANVPPGTLATEDIAAPSGAHAIPRVASEHAAESVAAKGVNVSIVRLPQVHNTVKQGLVTYLIDHARQKGVSAYVGEGANRLPAAHLLDVAPLYRLAFEHPTPVARYHAVAEQGVPLKPIAEAIARGLNLPAISPSPEEAATHFGWMSMFAGGDAPASSALTQQQLGWTPTHTTLLDDLNHMNYFPS